MKRIALFVLLQIFVLSSSSYGQFGLGKLLDKVKKVSDLELSEEEEIELGAELSKKVRNYFGVQQDSAETRYVALVGNLLARQSDRPNLNYKFIILDTPFINAFAAPGGFIHITRGALGTIRSEAELAGVLGHEIGHVTAKHTLSELKKMKGYELAGEESSLTENSELLTKVVDDMFDKIILSGFSRKQELEADEIGVALAARAGYQPEGLAGFLESLKSTVDSENKKAGLTSSHPDTNERLKKIEKQIAKNDLNQGSKQKLDARYLGTIKYEFNSEELKKFAESAEGVEGVKGVTGSGESKDEEEAEDDKEKKKKRGLFGGLGRLTDPLKSGDKKETAEVTSSGAGKAVDPTKPIKSTGPINPAVVEVKIAQADLDKFKQDGNLQQSAAD